MARGIFNAFAPTPARVAESSLSLGVNRFQVRRKVLACGKIALVANTTEKGVRRLKHEFGDAALLKLWTKHPKQTLLQFLCW